jgi:hypothetical protein
LQQMILDRGQTSPEGRPQLLASLRYIPSRDISAMACTRR